MQRFRAKGVLYVDIQLVGSVLPVSEDVLITGNMQAIVAFMLTRISTYADPVHAHFLGYIQRVINDGHLEGDNLKVVLMESGRVKVTGMPDQYGRK